MMKATVLWNNSEDNLTIKERSVVSTTEGAARIDLEIDPDTTRERKSETVNWYKSTFLLEKNGADCYVIDFGVIKCLRKINIYINGVLCAVSACARSELRALVPSSVLKNGENSVLVVIIEAQTINMWPVGKGFVSYSPEDFKDICSDLPKNMTVFPCEKNLTVESAKQSDDGILISLSDKKQLNIKLYKNGTVRCTYPYPQKNLMEDLLAEQSAADEYILSEDESKVTVKGKTTICIEKSTLKLTFSCGEEKRVFQPFITENTAVLAYCLDNDEHIFGLGENAAPSLDKRGSLENIWVIHDFVNCDMAIPFFISTRGCGVYLNSSFHSVFDMGSIDNNTAYITNYDSSFDLFFISGGQPENIVDSYTQIIGRPVLPPKWAFGFWQAGTCVTEQQRATDTVEKYFRDDVPLDVVCIDPPWQSELCTLRWNDKTFPDHNAFIAFLKKNKLRLMLWTAPFLNRESSEFEAARQAGLLAGGKDYCPVHWWKGYDCGLWDFTNPDTCKLFEDRIKAIIDGGADGFKIDGGDNSEVPENVKFANGADGKQAHNLYPHYFAKCFHNAISKARPGERSVTWQRSAYVSAGKFPCKWGGDQFADFSGTRVLIKAGQGSGLCGVPFWSQDVGGFCISENTDEEFFIRSYEWGLMAPLSRAHGGKVEPWAYGERAYKITAECIRRRYRMLVYIYSLAYLAHSTGRPIMYPLFFDYSANSKTYSCDYQYKFGKYLMAAPICEKSTAADLSAEREIYFPSGKWYDFNTETIYDGGISITYRAALDVLPLFAAEGCILPLLSQCNHSDAISLCKLEIFIFPSEDGSSFAMYDDDGITNGYLDGTSDEILVTQKKTDDEIKLSIHTDRIRKHIKCKFSFDVLTHWGSANITANSALLQSESSDGHTRFELVYDTESDMVVSIRKGSLA